MARPRKTKTTDASEPKPKRRRASKTTAVEQAIEVSMTTAEQQVAEIETASEIPADEIASEAYRLFLARNGQPGDALTDWLTAEQIVRERRYNGAA